MCLCHQPLPFVNRYETGIFPNARAGEIATARAFQRTGVTRNVGGTALILAFSGFLFFPIGLLGALLGLYTICLRPSGIRRYSGWRAAGWAIVLGMSAFIGEGAIAMSWLAHREYARQIAIQETAPRDLNSLMREEQHFHSMHHHFATVGEINFIPPYGYYSLYLGLSDTILGLQGDLREAQNTVKSLQPVVMPQFFRILAAYNLDKDNDLDVWIATSDGSIQHVFNDLTPLSP